MSSRAERIARFRSKMGTTRFSGGTVGGLSVNGQSTRTYNIGSGDSAVKLTVGSDGRVAAVSSTTTKSGTVVTKVSSDGIKSASGRVVTALSYDGNENTMTATAGYLSISNKALGIITDKTITIPLGEGLDSASGEMVKELSYNSTTGKMTITTGELVLEDNDLSIEETGSKEIQISGQVAANGDVNEISVNANNYIQISMRRLYVDNGTVKTIQKDSPNGTKNVKSGSNSNVVFSTDSDGNILVNVYYI